MAKWQEIGTVYKGKEGKGSYIKIKETVTLAAGTIIQVQDPREKLDRLVSSGHISEEQAEQRKANLKDFVLFELVLPPPQTKR